MRRIRIGGLLTGDSLHSVKKTQSLWAVRHTVLSKARSRMHTMLTPHLHLHRQTRLNQLELCKLVTAGRYLQFCRFVVQYPAISRSCSWNEGVVNKAWQLLANTRHHAPEHLQLIRWCILLSRGKGVVYTKLQFSVFVCLFWWTLRYWT